MSSATAGSRGRTLISVGLAVAISVLLVAMWWSLSGQATGEVASQDNVVLAQDDSEDESGDEDLVLETTSIDVTYDVFLARDPFETIRPPEPVAADTTDDDDNGNGTAVDENGDPIAGDPTNGDPSASKDPICRDGTEAVCAGSVVVLDSVGDGFAQVQVNGQSYVVAPGQAFAGNYQLLGLDGDCAQFLFQDGDEAETFTLCVGGSVAK